jgi:hypothetical protein
MRSFVIEEKSEIRITNPEASGFDIRYSDFPPLFNIQKASPRPKNSPFDPYIPTA